MINQNITKNCSDYDENVTHIKPHGALNVACEDFDLANTIAKVINSIDKILYF